MDPRASTIPVAATRAFLVVAALLFTGSAALTLAWCGSMSDMPGMDMPGGWTMSMAWMRMPGQSWSGAGAAFLGMWLSMMIAMMLPALLPALSDYRRTIYRAGVPLIRLTLTTAGAYFCAWLLLGALAFPVGVLFAEWTMRVPALARAVPLAAGVVVVLAGALQLTPWKARQLDCCRGPAARRDRVAASLSAAARHGLRLGLRCCQCCLPMTVALLVVGVMDLRAMVAATAAISAERLLPGGRRVARLIGVVMIVSGAIYLLETSFQAVRA